MKSINTFFATLKKLLFFFHWRKQNETFWGEYKYFSKGNCEFQLKAGLKMSFCGGRSLLAFHGKVSLWSKNIYSKRKQWKARSKNSLGFLCFCVSGSSSFNKLEQKWKALTALRDVLHFSSCFFYLSLFWRMKSLKRCKDAVTSEIFWRRRRNKAF